MLGWGGRGGFLPTYLDFAASLVFTVQLQQLINVDLIGHICFLRPGRAGCSGPMSPWPSSTAFVQGLEVLHQPQAQLGLLQ